MGMTKAAVGFTVKSGWAAVVVLGGEAASPHVVESCRIDLSDPEIPDSRQPYHAGFGTARKADAERARLLGSVKKFGGRSVTTILRRFRDAGHDLAAAAVVVGSTADPSRIANDHIRIHALEGQLFRQVVENAATRGGLDCQTWRQRDLHAAASTILERDEDDLQRMVAAMGRETKGAWRVEQKLAATAAWMALAPRPRRAAVRKITNT
jgi:hypothetical protein